MRKVLDWHFTSLATATFTFFDLTKVRILYYTHILLLCCVCLLDFDVNTSVYLRRGWVGEFKFLKLTYCVIIIVSWGNYVRGFRWLSLPTTILFNKVLLTLPLFEKKSGILKLDVFLATLLGYYCIEFN